MNKLAKAWDQFLFASVPIRWLDIFRRVYGVLVLTDLIALYPSRLVWWSEHGILSREGAIRYGGRVRLNVLNFLPPSDTVTTALCLALMVAAVLLIFGKFTRASSIALFVGLASLTHRNPMILNSGDTFIRICAFWLIFAPSAKNAEQKIPAWPLRLLQIQFMIVYLMTFLCKIQGSEWLDGTAVAYALRLEEFYRFPLPEFIFSNGWMQVMTWGALAIEGALAVLIWVPRLRLWVIASALALHLGIDYAMNIPLFEWIMMWSLVLFLNEDDYKKIRDVFFRIQQKYPSRIWKKFSKN